MQKKKPVTTKAAAVRAKKGTPDAKKRVAKKTTPARSARLATVIPVVKCACTCNQEYVGNPVRTQGLLTGAGVLEGNHDLVSLKGPGVFLCAEIAKQGGSNDLTFIVLDIDGRNVVNLSVAAMINQGITWNNPYGLAVFQTASLKTVTIGYAVPLKFTKDLKLSVVISESNVVQILGNVITGSV